MNRSLITWFLYIFASSVAIASPGPDTLKIKYDSFSDYHSRGVNDSAFATGMELFVHPGINEYSAWFYPKFADVILEAMDDTNSGITLDMVNSFFTKAALSDRSNLVSYKLYHAFLLDRYFNQDFSIVYPIYQIVIEASAQPDEAVLKRISSKASETDLRDTATILSVLDIMTWLLEKYPEEPKWGEAIANLTEGPDDLLKLRLKLHELKPGSASNNWAIASILIEKESFRDALIYLQRLVSEFPDVLKYWKALTYASEKSGNDEKSLEGYLRLIKLDPAVREYYFNAAVLFEKKDNYGAAVKYFKLASEVSKGWGKALYYEGLVYENSARSCGTLDFYSKCVYQIAYEKYLNASGYEPALQGVQERINEVEKYLPDPEEFKTNGYNPGDQIKIKGSCYIWIEELLKVQ